MAARGADLRHIQEKMMQEYLSVEWARMPWILEVTQRDMILCCNVERSATFWSLGTNAMHPSFVCGVEGLEVFCESARVDVDAGLAWVDGARATAGRAGVSGQVSRWGIREAASPNCGDFFHRGVWYWVDTRGEDSVLVRRAADVTTRRPILMDGFQVILFHDDFVVVANRFGRVARVQLEDVEKVDCVRWSERLPLEKYTSLQKVAGCVVSGQTVGSEIEYTGLSIFDGAEKFRFRCPLSSQGLAVTNGLMVLQDGSRVWFSRDGINRVHADEGGFGSWGRYWFDGRRLWGIEWIPDDNPRQPTRIVAVDVSSGERCGHIDVPEGFAVFALTESRDGSTGLVAMARDLSAYVDFSCITAHLDRDVEDFGRVAPPERRPWSTELKGKGRKASVHVQFETADFDALVRFLPIAIFDAALMYGAHSHGARDRGARFAGDVHVRIDDPAKRLDLQILEAMVRDALARCDQKDIMGIARRPIEVTLNGMAVQRARD